MKLIENILNAILDGKREKKIQWRRQLKKETKKKNSIFWDKFLTKKQKPCCTIKAKYHNQTDTLSLNETHTHMNI